MAEKLIPTNVQFAAKRGFIRTSAQSLAATLTTGISATVVLGVVNGEVEVIPTIITLGVALLSPFIAGAASYFSIISNGLPEAYIPAALDKAADAENEAYELGAHPTLYRTNE